MWFWPCNSTSKSVSTITNGGVLTRRSGSNLGIEDMLDLEGSDDDRDSTLVRQPQQGGFQFGTSRRVNGTSERNNTKNKKHFGIFQNKPKSEGDQPATTKRQDSVSDLSDTNKKILSHWNSGVERGMKIFQYGFTRTKWDEAKKFDDQEGRNVKNTEQKQSSFDTKSSNTIQQSLQNVMTLKNHLDSSQIFSSLTQGADKSFFSSKLAKKEPEHVHVTPLPVQPPPPTPPTLSGEKNCLEKFLELDHGEFQFIDEGATLTRNTSPPPLSKNLSISSLANEIFQELGKSNLGDEASSSASRFRHHHQRRRRNLSTASMSSVPPFENGSNDYYGETTTSSWSESVPTSDQNTKGDSKNKQRRYRNLSTASMTATSAPTETCSLQHDVSTEKFIPKTDSQLIASLLEDQTLWLRHQKKHRRRQPIQPWVPGAKWQLQPRSQGQDQVNAHQVAPDHRAVLRRCSSLTQTNTDEATLPRPSESPRLSSPGTSAKGIRFLYSGKYRPTTSNSADQSPLNNQYIDNRRISMISVNQQQQPPSGPWLLSNNLSTFARRRRSSSTSLHTYQDDVEDNIVYNNNNIKPVNEGEMFGDHR